MRGRVWITTLLVRLAWIDYKWLGESAPNRQYRVIGATRDSLPDGAGGEKGTRMVCK